MRLGELSNAGSYRPRTAGRLAGPISGKWDCSFQWDNEVNPEVNQPVMDVFPDIVFHRYFSTLSSEQRKTYRGKLDLAKPSLTEFEQLLVDIQDVLNESLREANTDVGHHVEHPPFHVDYIDSDFEKAIAFRHEGFSFIGLTEPLIKRLWCVCDALTRVAVDALRPALPLPIDPDASREVLFRLVLSSSSRMSTLTTSMAIHRARILI